MFKNHFLVFLGWWFFVSDTRMRKNRYLVCFRLLVFVSDTCMLFLGVFWVGGFHPCFMYICQCPSPYKKYHFLGQHKNHFLVGFTPC